MAFVVSGFDISVNRFDFGVDLVWNLKNKDGSAFDLSGYDVEFILKREKYIDDADAIFSTRVVGAGSSVVIPLTEEMTSSEAGVYHYALRLIKQGVYVDTIVQAEFVIVCNSFSEGA